MLTKKYLDICRSLLRENGLKLWAVRMNKYATNWVGICRHDEKRIEFSEKLLTQGTHDEIMETIRHEVAHALVGAEAEHNSEWKKQINKLGGKGQIHYYEL